MRLILLFFYTLFLALFLSAFFPSQRFFYFVPFIVVCIYECHLTKALWWAVIVGLIVDLLSVETRLGFYAFTYCITTACLYRYQYQFFEDSLSTLPIMTFLFVLLATLLQALALFLLGKTGLFSWHWIYLDLIWSPFKDSMYSFCAFTLPLVGFAQIKRYWFLRKRRKR